MACKWIAENIYANLVVSILGLLVVEAGSLLVIASLGVQSGGLLAVESVKLPTKQTEVIQVQ